MTGAAAFSESYFEARERFRAAAAAAGFRLSSEPLAHVEPAGLTVDIAVRPGLGAGPAGGRRALMLSSGLHGVEGYFGSAVQLALLQDPKALDALSERRVVLAHALNPFGMCWGRRWNEDNVDLNRNFLEWDQGAPPAAEAAETAEADYARLAPLLNPASPPRRPDLFRAGAAGAIARHGYRAVKIAVSTGQSRHPTGLFYTGRGPSWLRLLLERRLGDWVGAAVEVDWLDLHTGLGPRGAARLFPREPLPAAERALLTARHGSAAAPLRRDGDVVMPNRGLMLDWVPRRFPTRRWRVLTAEFGTLSPVRVVQALRAENRAWHWGDRRRTAGGPQDWSGRALRAAFVPSDPGWRAHVVTGALRFVAEIARSDAGAAD